MRSIRNAALPALGLALAALLLARPGDAALGAAQAMVQWATTVAPSMLPFLALLPLLAGSQAAAAYRRLLGKPMALLFGLPGELAPAVAVGMLAGSPAGALAARRAAGDIGLPRGQLTRVAVCCAGFSPAFLLGGIGAGMLGDAALGAVLLRAQLLTQTTLLLLTRRAWRGRTEPVPPLSSNIEEAPVRGAVLAALTVCGWMTLFGALTWALRGVVGRGIADGLLCLLDLPAGARLVAASGLPDAIRLPLLAGLCGFGGLCVGLQNLAALRDCGVRPGEYFATRAAAAALTAGCAALQLRVKLPAPPLLRPLPLAALCACGLAVPALASPLALAARRGRTLKLAAQTPFPELYRKSMEMEP